MHNAIVEEIRNATDGLLQSNDELKNAIVSSGHFEANDIIPGTDYSATELNYGIATLCNFASGIDIKDSGPFIPRSFLEALLARLKEIQTQCLEVTSAFENNGGIKSWNSETFVAVYRNDSQQNFSKSLRNLYGRVDAAFAAWYQLRTVLRTPKISEFGRLAAQLQERNSLLSTLDTEIAEKRDAIKNNLDKSQTNLDSSSAAATEINRLLKDTESSRKTISEYLAEATTKTSDIKSIEERASALDSAVAEYQTTFDTFDEELENRTKRFDQENAKLDEIHKSLDSGRNEIKRLIDESEGLLRGATNVGLAASFSALQTKIAKELGWSRFSFYVSIGFLIVLSLPIALYVFPGLQALASALGIDVAIVLPKGVIGEHSTPDTLAQIAARALLLIPGIWLVRFAGARHERLFRLREQYAYKYSIASSVEGFKRQAPDLEQGIAATAFYELTFNPATRMDANSSEARYPNPAMEWFMKKLGGQAEAAK